MDIKEIRCGYQENITKNTKKILSCVEIQKKLFSDMGTLYFYNKCKSKIIFKI